MEEGWSAIAMNNIAHNQIFDPYMHRALQLARRGDARVGANPFVGCVIVKGGVVVGEGYHAQFGGPHAEIVALAEAGAKAKGATVYVTLEPCNHQGKTPPCSEALIQAGVSRVIIGMADPTNLAANGSHRLIEAGVDVEFAKDPSPYRELNRGWLKRVSTGLPFVMVKQGLSLDAHISLKPSSPTTVTGISGHDVTQQLRSEANAVLVSSSTAMADNPSLTVRSLTGEVGPVQPVRVVLMRQTIPQHTLNLFTDGLAETVALCPDNVDMSDLRTYGVEVVSYPVSGGLRAALLALGALGINTVLVEAGRRLFTELFNAELIDEYITVVAGGVLGEGAVSNYGGLPHILASTPDRPVLIHSFRPRVTEIVGDVVVTRWAPSQAESDRG